MEEVVKMENESIKTYLIVENNKIVNIVLAQPTFAEENGWIDPGENDYAIGYGYENGVIIPPPPDKILSEIWEQVRIKRDILLKESDIYILSDRWNSMTVEKQKEWEEYRQKLRDIPQTHYEPFQIDWPTKP
jgi:hypothetical protein